MVCGLGHANGQSELRQNAAAERTLGFSHRVGTVHALQGDDAIFLIGGGDVGACGSGLSRVGNTILVIAHLDELDGSVLGILDVEHGTRERNVVRIGLGQSELADVHVSGVARSLLMVGDGVRIVGVFDLARVGVNTVHVGVLVHGHVISDKHFRTDRERGLGGDDVGRIVSGRGEQDMELACLVRHLVILASSQSLTTDSDFHTIRVERQTIRIRIVERIIVVVVASPNRHPAGHLERDLLADGGLGYSPLDSSLSSLISSSLTPSSTPVIAFLTAVSLTL